MWIRRGLLTVLLPMAVLGAALRWTTDAAPPAVSALLIAGMAGLAALSVYSFVRWMQIHSRQRPRGFPVQPGRPPVTATTLPRQKAVEPAASSD